jgi:hypothetical protein
MHDHAIQHEHRGIPIRLVCRVDRRAGRCKNRLLLASVFSGSGRGLYVGQTDQLVIREWHLEAGIHVFAGGAHLSVSMRVSAIRSIT